MTNAPRALFGSPGRRTVALIAIAALAFTALTACATTTKKGTGSSSSPASSSEASSAPPSSTAPASPSVTPVPVHVSLLENDGSTWGVGMPIIVYFTQNITDSAAFLKATTVKVNGQPAGGAWFFEANGDAAKPLTAHYRTQGYWPANSAIQMNMPVEGLSGGGAFVFDDSLTLAMNIGDSHVSTVDCAAERMTVMTNGAPAFPAPFPTSCGASTTPTAGGTKVVMQLGEDFPAGSNTLRPMGAVRMVGGGGALGNYDLLVNWSVRVTQGGEYVHSAPWNGNNIGARSTSDGCTNLSPTNAQAFYQFSHVGDVVIYTNTGGPGMKVDDGFGDWNLAWSTWQAGGRVQASTS